MAGRCRSEGLDPIGLKVTERPGFPPQGRWGDAGGSAGAPAQANGSLATADGGADAFGDWVGGRVKSRVTRRDGLGSAPLQPVGQEAVPSRSVGALL